MFKQSSFVIATLLLVTSCGNTEKPTTTEQDTQKEEVAVASTAVKVENALSFINGYVENSNNMNEAMNIIDWVNANQLSSDAFKTTLKNIIEEAFKEDSEMGLDADPIYDAQDYPEKGFELVSFDEKTNYLTVKGIDWPDFTLTLKVVEEKGKWVVDGCGSVNVPKDKRAER
jgi:hypothetical protein